MFSFLINTYFQLIEIDFLIFTLFPFNLNHLLLSNPAVLHQRHCETPSTNPPGIMFVAVYFYKQHTRFWRVLEASCYPWLWMSVVAKVINLFLRYLPLRGTLGCEGRGFEEKQMLRRFCRLFYELLQF